MQRKRNESELGEMMRSRYGCLVHKWRDRGFVSCPNCHTQIKVCPVCKQSMLLNKAETKPDHLVVPPDLYLYVEAKEGHDSWPFLTSIRDTQREVMLEVNSDYAWLFLTMGLGRAPKGRSAWLMRWIDWLETEKRIVDKGWKSIIYESTSRSKAPSAKSLFPDVELAWERGGWSIPPEHYFWTRTKQLWTLTNTQPYQKKLI